MVSMIDKPKECAQGNSIEIKLEGTISNAAPHT